MLMIDTLQTTKELQKSGLKEESSEIIATKFKEIQQEYKKEFVSNKKFNSEIRLLRKDIKSEANSIRSELKFEVGLIKQEFKLVRQEIKYSMLTTIISLGTIVALIEKFL